MSRKGSMTKLLDRVAHDESTALASEASEFFASAKAFADGVETVLDKYEVQRNLVHAARKLIGAARDIARGMPGRVRPRTASPEPSDDIKYVESLRKDRDDKRMALDHAVLVRAAMQRKLDKIRRIIGADSSHFDMRAMIREALDGDAAEPASGNPPETEHVDPLRSALERIASSDDTQECGRCYVPLRIAAPHEDDCPVMVARAALAAPSGLAKHASAPPNAALDSYAQHGDGCASYYNMTCNEDRCDCGLTALRRAGTGR